MRSWRVAAALTAVTAVLLLFAGRARPLPPGDERIYASPLVTPAPPAPPEAASAFRFEDARGAYQRLEFGAGAAANATPPYVNLVFTRAGHLRSGDIHACEQLNHIVFGAATLTQLRGGRDVVTRLAGGDVVRIPPHTPHLYEFTRDSLMTETWRTPSGEPCAFRAWLYGPYRARIPAATTDKRFVDGAAAG